MPNPLMDTQPPPRRSLGFPQARLGWAAGDLYRDDAPHVHIIEGEGGMTPGRVAEAFAAAATASLDNIILHIDWNQASIDSNHVCRDGEAPGEYVQWTPAELAYLHDWNVVYVPDGFDWQQITKAQRLALDFHNGQPTALVTAFAQMNFSPQLRRYCQKTWCRSRAAKPANSAAALAQMRQSSRNVIGKPSVSSASRWKRAGRWSMRWRRNYARRKRG